MLYAKYDENGSIISFLDTRRNNNIPANVIEITFEQWQEFLGNPGKYKVNDARDGFELAPIVTPDPMPGIRAQRNKLLAESDWTQLADVNLSPEQKEAWKIYRQTLRDFPETCDPFNPAWPVPPI
jgi:hypothetical protein